MRLPSFLAFSVAFGCGGAPPEPTSPSEEDVTEAEMAALAAEIGEGDTEDEVAPEELAALEAEIAAEREPAPPQPSAAERLRAMEARSAPPAVPAPTDGCLARVTRTRTVDGAPVLEAVLRNDSAVDLTLHHRDPCPNGAAAFAGIDGFDWYSTCNVGMCPAGEPVAVTVPAGGEVVLASTQVPGTGCQNGVADGTYRVTFDVPGATGAGFCPGFGAAGLQARGGRLRPVRPPAGDAETPSACPLVRCDRYCPEGWATDRRGCPRCACAD